MSIANCFCRLLEHLESTGTGQEDVEVEFVSDHYGEALRADVRIAGRSRALSEEVIFVPTALDVDILAL